MANTKEDALKKVDATRAKTKGFINEFKEFISRGNVMDMAVGIIMGTAFTAIVNSLVNDLIMPLVGWLFGGIDFTNLKFVIRPAAEGIEEAALYYGNFIQNVVDFLLIAWVVFIMVKVINNFHRKKDEEPAPEEPAAPAEDIALLTEIRDLLKNK